MQLSSEHYRVAEESLITGPPHPAVTRMPAARESSALVVILHDISGNHANWIGGLPALATEPDVLVPDLRGYGASDFHPVAASPLAFDDLVSPAARVLKAIGRPTHVPGLSMGGLMPQAVADQPISRQPVLVQGGKADRLALFEQMRALAAAIPGAARRLFPGVGHLVSLVAPEEFRSAVTGFWSRVEDAAC